MKKLIFLALLAAAMSAQGQDVRFGAYVEPGLANDVQGTAWGLGAGVDYQMSIVYLTGHLFASPDMGGASYIDLGGSVGLNAHLFRKHARIYSGLTLGPIFRDFSAGAAYIGAEAGLDYYFKGEELGLFIGLRVSTVHASDDKYFDPSAEGQTRNSAGLRLGFTF